MSTEPQQQQGEEAPPEVDFSQIDVDQVPALVSSVTDEQLGELMNGSSRDQVIAEVFRQMEQHFKPQNAQGVDAVIHWRITGPSQDQPDHWEVVVKDGKCTTTDEPQHEEARVSLQLDGLDFLKLVTGNVAGPTLFMTQKLSIKGDLAFSAGIQGMFSIPTGAKPSA